MRVENGNLLKLFSISEVVLMALSQLICASKLHLIFALKKCKRGIEYGALFMLWWDVAP